MSPTTPLRIGIIDYGMGNLLSVANAIDFLGLPSLICSEPRQLSEASHIILPGVGAFPDCVHRLATLGFTDALQNLVINRQVPFLGICLGMQILATDGSEGCPTKGLNWIEGHVIRITPTPASLPVPHIGWNETALSSDCPLFRGMASSADLYFVHSYHLSPTNNDTVAATCNYGMPVVAAVQKGHIFGVQFHPEKSQDKGLTILKNFAEWRSS